MCLDLLQSSEQHWEVRGAAPAASQKMLETFVCLLKTQNMAKKSPEAREGVCNKFMFGGLSFAIAYNSVNSYCQRPLFQTKIS